MSTTLAGSIDDYARRYLSGNTVTTSRDETRADAKGRSYEFVSADGATRYQLLLVAEGERALGLHAQGAAASWEGQRPALEEISRSFTLERPARYPETRDAAFGFSLRTPPSWPQKRRFSGAGTLLLQYASPPLAMDKGQQAVHAFLTLSVEPLPKVAPTLDAYYDATRLRQGAAFKILSHEPWRNGYVDVSATETTISASRVKRFCVVAGERGYSLTCEAPEDVYSRVSPWCDLIAATLQTGS